MQFYVVYMKEKRMQFYYSTLRLEGCALPLFDELREPNLRLPNNNPPPPLFDFKPQELFGPVSSRLLIPEWYRTR